MLFVKLTIVFTFIMFLWATYIIGKLKNDVEFNGKINVSKEYPKWYLVFCACMLLDVISVFISLVYVLFFVWR